MSDQIVQGRAPDPAAKRCPVCGGPLVGGRSDRPGYAVAHCADCARPLYRLIASTAPVVRGR